MMAYYSKGGISEWLEMELDDFSEYLDVAEELYKHE